MYNVLIHFTFIPTLNDDSEYSVGPATGCIQLSLPYCTVIWRRGRKEEKERERERERANLFQLLVLSIHHSHSNILSLINYEQIISPTGQPLIIIIIIIIITNWSFS